MFSVKAILDKSRNKNGKYQVLIRTTINRRSSYKFTGFWVKELVPGSKVGMAVRKLISDEESRLTGKVISGQPLDFERRGKPFCDYCTDKIRQLKHSKSAGTIRNYEKHIAKFKRYAGNRYFNAITPKVLNGYYTHLKGQGLADNYVWDAFKVLKKFWNMAMSEDIIYDYPFKKMETKPRYRSKPKIYLTLEELNKLEALRDKLSGSYLLTLDYFLLACYSGLRFSDWNFQIEKLITGDSLKLTAKKNREPIYIPIDISPRLKNAIKRISKPYTLTLEATNRNLKSIAVMAGIDKNITTHTGRHTMATLSLELNMSIYSIAEILGISVRVCEIYAKTTRQKIERDLAAWRGVL